MSQIEFDPLNLVESLAEEYAEMAAAHKLHVNGYGMPELPSAVVSDAEAIKNVLRIMANHAIARLDGGALLFEALRDTVTGEIRFGLSNSRNDLTANELEKLRLSIENERCSGSPVKTILEHLRTELHFDDQVIGRSTRFFFPIKGAHIEWEPAAFNADSALLNQKIFLVANDPPPNRIIQQYFRYYGVHMEGAPTAGEALTVLGARVTENTPLDILGVAPPIEDMNAFELATAIKQSDLKQLKLFYVAPWRDEANISQARDSGFDMVLCKPFTKRQLFEEVVKLADQKLSPIDPRPVILIVEDNPVNQKLAIFQLRSLGFESVVVGNGQDAVEACKTTRFAAVLMDIQMPILDGITATRLIRHGEADTGARVPIIGLTANSQYRNEALRTGMDDFILKPASKEQLQEVLRRFNIRAA